ncbi:MAG: hypothetical protein WC560_06445 [Syntrophales bacterium]
MEWIKIIIEFLKVLLSTQMVICTAIIVFLILFNDEVRKLLKRLIKLPAGVEFSMPQTERLSTEKPIVDKISPEPQSSSESMPAKLQDDKEGVKLIETLTSLYQTERSRAYFWEYSYLNYFLVPRTQQVLDWIAALTTPLSADLFNSLWMPFITDIKERNAVIAALETHILIIIENNLISITPKGREYIGWRGKVLNPPKNTL